MTDLTAKQVDEIAEAAAGKAVRQTFRLFGVDVEDQNSVNEFRSDLVHARKIRRFTESSAARAWLVIIGVATIGLATAAWKGFIGLFE